MIVEKITAAGSLVEVLDRVLDKGIVIDAWIRVALVGIDLITIQARVVVASIQTYLESSEALVLAASGSVPAVAAPVIPTGLQTPKHQPRRGARKASRFKD